MDNPTDRELARPPPKPAKEVPLESEGEYEYEEEEEEDEEEEEQVMRETEHMNKNAPICKLFLTINLQ